MAFFLTPGFEGLMAIIGTLHARFHYHLAPEKFKDYIVQVTTTGQEPELVRQSIEIIRGYELDFVPEIWVVNEPGNDNNYPMADRVITVPADFECLPIQKARALEYSRVVRQGLGLNRADVKITLIDDDSLPSQKYMELAYKGDYDICQGATVANRGFGRHGLQHFIISHLDNIRVRNCMVYCSCGQGIFNKPMFVHGEGLTYTGLVEEHVTWNHRIIASDDLVFGSIAGDMGFSWGYFNAAIQIISPWTFKEAWKQRKRWTWGNMTAIWNRDILPLNVAIPKGAKYVQGVSAIVISTAGAVLLYLGFTRVPHQAHYLYWTSLGMWDLSYWVAAWVNASGQPNRDLFYKLRGRHRGPSWWIRLTDTSLGQKFYHWKAGLLYFLWRFTQAAIGGTIMLPFTALYPAFIIFASLLTGKPKSFVVIRKSNPSGGNI